jgi:hypothetical protein
MSWPGFPRQDIRLSETSLSERNLRSDFDRAVPAVVAQCADVLHGDMPEVEHELQSTPGQELMSIPSSPQSIARAGGMRRRPSSLHDDLIWGLIWELTIGPIISTNQICIIVIETARTLMPNCHILLRSRHTGSKRRLTGCVTAATASRNNAVSDLPEIPTAYSTLEHPVSIVQHVPPKRSTSSICHRTFTHSKQLLTTKPAVPVGIMQWVPHLCGNVS